MATLDYNTYGGGRDMGRVVHFELSADDPERAVAFNRTVFEIKTTQDKEDVPWPSRKSVRSTGATCAATR